MNIKNCTHSVDGTPIKIYEVYESKIHGTYYDTACQEWVIAVWSIDGENTIPCNHTLDLHNWRDDIPWDIIIPGIRWVAMDENGLWYGYTHEPYLDFREWRPSEEQFIKDRCWDLGVIKMPNNPYWKQSLVKRPRSRDYTDYL